MECIGRDIHDGRVGEVWIYLYLDMGLGIGTKLQIISKQIKLNKMYRNIIQNFILHLLISYLYKCGYCRINQESI